MNVEAVERHSFVDYFDLIGTVRGANEATLVFEVGGVLETVLADKGTAVKKGAVVARLDASLYQAGFDEAKAGYEIAKQTYERSAPLVDQGAISDLDLASLRNELEMARARMASARYQLDHASVRAPFSGLVDSRFIDVGNYAAPGAPFARLVQTDVVKVEVPIPEIHFARVKAGDDAWVRADQYAGRVFEGVVTFVSAEVDQLTRTVTAEIRLTNEGRALRPGMTVRAKLIKERYSEAIVVPQDAVVITENGPAVFLNVNGVAESRLVEVITVHEELAVIGSGLEEGLMLVTTGARDLVSGESLEVLP